MARRKRKSLGNKTRFEVFKRDSFKCQYCGRCSPDVVLEVDHIDPHSKGGEDDLLNLVTSCRECNSGKSDRRLDDDSALAKQRAQLQELNEKREQLEMMLAWREGLQGIEADAATAFAEAYKKAAVGWSLNDKGMKTVRAVLRKTTLVDALAALDRAADQCLEFSSDGKATQDSVEHLLNLWRVLSQPEDVQSLYKIRARVRRRWNYVDDQVALRLLKRALDAGASVDEIDLKCTEWIDSYNTSFRWWRDNMEDWTADLLRSKVGR